MEYTTIDIACPPIRQSLPWTRPVTFSRPSWPGTLKSRVLHSLNFSPYTSLYRGTLLFTLTLANPGQLLSIRVSPVPVKRPYLLYFMNEEITKQYLV